MELLEQRRKTKQQETTTRNNRPKIAIRVHMQERKKAKEKSVNIFF